MSGLWDLHPRDTNLGRTLNPLSRWHELTLVERHNLPDTWIVTGPADVLGVFAPGMGMIVDLDGEQVTSGQARSIRRTRSVDPKTGRVENVVQVGFVSDRDVLAQRLCFPNPAHDLTTTMSTFSTSHDIRTGPVETVLLGYIAANAGPAAPIARRRIPGLVLPSSLGRGGTTTVKARMDNLGTLVHDLAEGGGLRVNVVHDESTGTPRLLLTVAPVVDVSANVVFGDVDSLRATAFVTDLDYTLEAGEVTDAVVFAAGQEEARAGARFADEAAVALWGARRELLVDQRQTDDVADIARAGAKALEDGASPTSITFTVSDSADVRYWRDYRVGYRVGVELPGIPEALSDNVVREVTTTVRRGAPTVRKVAVGTPGAAVGTTKEARRVANAMRRINVVERGL
ncbi:siphovirus ReqiPepy6 Gp37-like family protein [Cellulosimicrobium terreum]|nr:siphovirus ReqiPepy6 Gp37-like family protein [Cellulosimicrobium terreum]